MNTFMETMALPLRKAWQSKSFAAAWALAVDFALQIVDSNRLGRAEDRALRKNISKKKLEKIYRDVLRESLKKDEFFEVERDFYREFANSEWLDGMEETLMLDDEAFMCDADNEEDDLK